MKKVLFFIIFLISVCGYCQKSNINFKDILLLDIRGKEFAFSDSINQPAIILYYSEPNCHACIDEILSFMYQKNIKNFFVIAQDRNDVIYRKQVLKRFSGYETSVKAIYFDNIKRDYPLQSSFSGLKKSPWLILYKTKCEIITNEEIFDQKSEDLKFSRSFEKKMNKH